MSMGGETSDGEPVNPIREYLGQVEEDPDETREWEREKLPDDDDD